MKGRVIGLTGPMCSGKNAAAAILAQRGFAVADADQIAHQALEALTPSILREFTQEALLRGLSLQKPDGTLNRRALGELVFPDPELLARHEALVYPEIDRRITQFISDHSSENIVLNAPTLHKSATLARCEFVLYIDAGYLIRFFRALRRDKLPARQIIARFRAQKSFFAQYILKNVDILKVKNSGSIRALEKKLARLLAQKGL